ncbi:hypothetical protein DPMN_009728 [Dreissena polymorpha]|uniref:Uncharacterized protein n=1 Tax=Dreissena polymorpha TaxID=45954 RepID=A0A9D4N2S4_DREPO|nr:hypothetical protein DPMN_009728 [Dreissena polymorpha]
MPLIVQYSQCGTNIFRDPRSQGTTMDAKWALEAVSVCGSKSHFTAMLGICLPTHAAIRDMTLNRFAS